MIREVYNKHSFMRNLGKELKILVNKKEKQIM